MVRFQNAPRVLSSLRALTLVGTMVFGLSLAFYGGKASAQVIANRPHKKASSEAKPEENRAKTSKKSSKTMGMQRRVLVFPPDTKGGVSDQLTDIVSDVEQARLALSNDYRSAYFTIALPTIRRALLESSLSTGDTSAPFDDLTKAKKLAQIAGYDMVLVTSIDDYQYDAAKKKISLVMSARLIDLSKDKPVIRSAGESAASADNAAKSEKDIAPALQVARDLTEKIMSDILKPAKAGEGKADTKENAPK